MDLGQSDLSGIGSLAESESTCQMKVMQEEKWRGCSEGKETMHILS